MIGIGVSEPLNVTPGSVVPVSTSPVELDLIGFGVSPVDVAVVGRIPADVDVFSIVEREIGVPFSPSVMAVVLVVTVLCIGLGVSLVREGSLVVPLLDP